MASLLKVDTITSTLGGQVTASLTDASLRRGLASGVAPLGADSKVPAANLAAALTIESVANAAALAALTVTAGQVGQRLVTQLDTLVVYMAATAGGPGVATWVQYSTMPAATESVSGTAELATQAETDAGTNDATIVTPLKLANNSFLNAIANTRRAAQGLNFDGSCGATVANVPAFGTGDFTVAAIVTPTDFSAIQCVFAGAVYSFDLRINTSGFLQVSLTGTLSLAESTTALVAGKANFIAYVELGNVGTYYINGKAAGTTNATGVNYSSPIAFFGSVLDAVTSVFKGNLTRPVIENRALSAAEVATLAETNTISAADLGNNASNATINLDPVFNASAPNAFDSGTFTQTDSFTGVKASGVSVAVFRLINQAVTPGQRLHVSGTMTRNNGKTVIPQAIIRDSSNGSLSFSVATSLGITSDGNFGVDVICTTGRTAAAGISMGFATSGDADVTITNVVVTRVGCLACYDESQPGGGPVWPDVSGNSAHLYLPTSGVTWAQPCGVGTTIAIPHTFLHSVISSTPGTTLFDTIPYGWAPVDWQIRVDVAFDSGTTIDVGSSSTQARYVSAQNIASTGVKQATPLVLAATTTAAGAPVYITKSGATTVGDLLTAVLVIRKIF